jgi:hypothetical protein
MRYLAVLLVAVLAAARAAAAADTPPQGDYGWLIGRWSCDQGGYGPPQLVDVVIRSVGAAAISVSWTAVPGERPQFVLRKGANGAWTFHGGAKSPHGPDHATWDLVQSTATPTDIAFTGLSHYVNSGVHADVPTQWEFIRTGDDTYAEWRTLRPA